MSLTRINVGVVSLVAAAACFVCPVEAKAFVDPYVSSSQGFICGVEFIPPSLDPQWGIYGGVYADLYSSVNCGGSFLGSFVFCSEQGDSSICNTSYRYREAALMSLWEGLVAVDVGHQMSAIRHTSGGKGTSVNFGAAGF